MRAVHTGDTQAIKVMPVRKDIKAAKIPQQQAATEAALPVNNQESEGSRKNNETTPTHQAQAAERINTRIKFSNADKGTNQSRKIHKTEQEKKRSILSCAQLFLTPLPALQQQD